MAGELLTGLIEIAVGIAAGPSPIWYILKGERSTINEIQTQMKTDMENIRSEMCATNNRALDEKISVLGHGKRDRLQQRMSSKIQLIV